MFQKGRIVDIVEKEQAKRTRFNRFGKATCPICKIEFQKYSSSQIYCNQTKRCKTIRGANHYKSLSKKDPITYLAYRLSGSLRMGKNKIENMKILLKNKIGTNCKFCNILIDLENASIDHKIPRKFDKVYSRELKRMIYSSKEIRKLDKIDNLQVICRNCNQLKGDMNDEEFVILNNFMASYPTIREKVWKRLKMARTFWQFKKLKYGT